MAMSRQPSGTSALGEFVIDHDIRPSTEIAGDSRQPANCAVLEADERTGVELSRDGRFAPFLDVSARDQTSR